MFPLWISKDQHRLALILTLAAALRVVFFHGFFPSDQHSYSIYALQIVQGTWNPGEPLATRWGILIPTALLYWLFGVNEFTSTVWSLLCSLGTVVVAFLLGRHLGDERSGLLAGLLLAVFPPEIIYAGQFMADAPLSFWLLLTLYSFLRGSGSGHEEVGFHRSYYLMSGVSLGMAYATKEVALGILPFFLIFFLVTRRVEWRLRWLAGGLGIIVALEYILFWVVSGNGLHRLASIREVRTARMQEIVGGLLGETTSLGAYLYWMIVDIHYVGIAFLVLLLALALRWGRSWRGTPNRAWSSWPLFLWGGTMFVFLTFFPLSFRPYIPVYKQFNYMLMFTAPLLVALALLLNDMPRYARYLGVGLIVLTSLPSVYLSRETHRGHLDNSRAIYAFSRQHGGDPVFMSGSNLKYAEYVDGFQKKGDYRDFTVGMRGLQESGGRGRIEFSSGYVAVDEYFLEFYGRRGHQFPLEVLDPPKRWQPVFRYQRGEHWLRSVSLTVFDMLYEVGVLGKQTHGRIAQRVIRWSPAKPVVIYRIS